MIREAEVAADPVRTVRRTGSEVGPDVRARLQQLLADGRFADASLRAVAADVLACVERLEQEVGQLRSALDSRVVIEQAKGVLIAGGHDEEAAFRTLVERSQRANRKLRLVAQEVVAEALGAAG